MAEEQSGFTVHLRKDEDGVLLVSLSGSISLENSDLLPARVEHLLDSGNPSAVKIDLAGISYLDSAGALALIRMEDGFRKKEIPFDYTGIPEKVRGIMGLINREGLARRPLGVEMKPPGVLEAVGDASVALQQDFIALMTFLGDLMAAVVHLVFHPREIRWDDVLLQIRKAGADGLPIVGVISLLIGLIIAFMSSLQLRQFGANIYVASLVTVAIVRELGPIMTAILVAGRSASAYAAEIGTMKVNEEVDALVVMGFDPIRFLAVPKLIAAVLVLPLLTLYADLFGILGGMIVGIAGLDLTAHTYLSASQRSITVFYLLSSLLKASVFAFVIAWIGCQRGFQVRGGVEAVGTATTSAVVTSILLIVIVDSVFAVALHYLR